MRVQVDGKYTYETNKRVAVGDLVVVPNPAWLQDVKGQTRECTVTSLESDYTGPCLTIIGVLKAK